MRFVRALLPAALLIAAAACASADPQDQVGSADDVAPASVAASSAPTPTPGASPTETTAAEPTLPPTTAPARKTTTAPKTTAPVEPAEPGLAADVRSTCPATAVACVNVDAQVAWLQRDGELAYGPVPITTGMPGYETPRGTFWVLRKHVEHVSSIYGTPMPYSVFFTDYGIAFHQGSLREQSHGCVHLSWEAAEVFYGALDYGAEIVVA